MSSNIATNPSQRAKVYDTWLKCLRLSNDRTTTAHEREAARVKSIELRAKLDAMDEETAPATNLARFRALVKQGKALLEEQDNINWKLGELASQVDKEYGKDKLQEFADELELKKQFLINCRTTFIAWPQKTVRTVFRFVRLSTVIRVVSRLYITWREARETMRKYREREAAKDDAKATAAKKCNGESRAVAPPEPAEPEPAAKTTKPTLRCTFCFKSQREAGTLIASSDDIALITGSAVCICDECVELCVDIIKRLSKYGRSLSDAS